MRVLRGPREGERGVVARRCERTGWVWLTLERYRRAPSYGAVEFGPYVPGVDVQVARRGQ